MQSETACSRIYTRREKRKISFPWTESDRGLHPRGWRVKACIDHVRTITKKIRKKGTKSLRTSAICTLERLLLPFLPCEGMEGKSKWKPRGRACSNCSTGPRQGLKLEEGETSGDSCIHEFRHWQITLTIRIPRIVRGLIRDVCVHPLPLIATSDYNGTVATWR